MKLNFVVFFGEVFLDVGRFDILNEYYSPESVQFLCKHLGSYRSTPLKIMGKSKPTLDISMIRNQSNILIHILPNKLENQLFENHYFRFSIGFYTFYRKNASL